MDKYESNMVLSTKKYKVIGTRPIRHDGTDKVTGAAKYGADFKPARLLHGATLRSPHAHARINSIDTSAAEALPGVKAVVTSKDFPLTAKSRKLERELEDVKQKYEFTWQNVLAGGKTLYKGHAVAAVAAISQHIANEALSLIKVDYQVLPPVLTALEGSDPQAPLLHDNLKTQSLGQKSDKPSNVAKRIRYQQGNVEKGFNQADIVIEREFNTKTVHQGYIEPHASTAFWNQDGRLHIWTSTQDTFGIRDTVADLLDIPVSRIKVTPSEIGGGFGGKLVAYLEPVASLLSRKTGTPVKLTMNRNEVFEGTGPTSGSHVKLKLGATNDGNVIAAKADLAFEAGAFPGSPVEPGAQCLFACYDIPNMDIEGVDVVVNKPKSAAYRAPGAPNTVFAMESLMDELAEKLHMDPLELRLKNTSTEGTRRVDGLAHRRIGVKELIDAMRSHPHYQTPLEGPNQGRGIAIGFWFNVGLASSCIINVNADGTIGLVEGNPDIGGTRASLAMQAAETLGIRAEDVQPTVVDTDLIGYTYFTAGSRTTFATGWAAYEASQDVKRQMITRAAEIWDVTSESIKFKDGIFYSTADSELKMSFKELASKLADTGGPIMGRSTINPKGVGGSAAGCMVDVAVDRETGKVDVLRVTAFQDAGKAIHPSYVEGQMQGGSVQGIGWALNEEYFYDDTGDMTNGTFLDYRMPTSLDLPMIDTVIVEVPNPGHPYGVRGVGEASIVPPQAAVANALHNAIGVRLDQLPMNPGAILEALWKNDSK